MRVLVHHLRLLPPSARKPAVIARICRKAAGVRAKGELNVVLLDRAAMRAMNKRYLNHSHDTDVIAFRYPNADGADAPFGDVYISAYQARRQAEQLGHSVLTEVLTLTAHGTLHLLGYDDATPRQKARMFRLQDELLAAIR